MGTSIVTEMVNLLIAAISGIARGIGEGLSTLATSVFTQTVEGVTTLSAFGALVMIFAGVSLAIGLSRWVVNFVTSLGARNR